MDDLHPLTGQPSVDVVSGQVAVTLPAGPVGRARASLRALEALDRITGQGTEPTQDDLVALQGWDVTRSLHNYCIWRSVRCLRPGGLAVLITSRYTMDARDNGARRAIADEADLVAAIRLPGDALAGGGTEVVADILVFRRRSQDGPGNAPGWTEAISLRDTFPDQEWEYADHVNQWFVAHPRMVLGEMRPDHAARYGRTLRVDRPDDALSLPAALGQATNALVSSASKAGLTWEPTGASFADVSAPGIPQRVDGRKERSFHLEDGTVWQVQHGELTPVTAAGRELAELTALIRLRDAAVSVLDAEADHDRVDDSIASLRNALNSAYDHYIAGYGPLNRATIINGDPDPETGMATLSRRRPRMGGFRQDPDYVTVLALENYDEEIGTASKTPIFSRRVNKRSQRPVRAGTPDEAIRICLDTHGCLDLPTIAGLLGIPVGQVPGELEGLAYLDPSGSDWVTAEEYLSGNVREKLVAARSAAGSSNGADEPRLVGNIAALENVQPTELEPGEIRAKLGAPWIPPSDVRAFATGILGYAPTVGYLPVTAQWEVKVAAGLADTAAATEEWGTARIDAYRLLELTLNGKEPAVYDTIQTPDGETRVRNQTETMLAEEKQRAMRERFAEWAWEDPDRCDRLCAEYNRRFNSVVPRRYNGAHLTFPGLADNFAPYPHQLDMVHRIISSPAALCPYPVGTGKTPTMFMAARKMRELGLALKPLIIVPNHLLEQTASEGKRLFPAARILIAAREDVASAQARKLFAARCATGDWDAVVMTHSAFTAIPVHPATEAAHLTDLAARYRQALTAEPSAGKRTVKQLAKMVDAFETRARTLLDHRTDDGVWFENLGADFVMVDESHYFKNLGVPVRTDGFSVAASKRATDLDMKLALLREQGGRSGALFTGTPVSNSLLEMYVLQHYLQPARLEEIGLHSADAWAATFVEFQTTVEVSPDGSGFRLDAPAKFENVPELLTLFGEVADLRPPGSFVVQRPDARHHTVVIPAGPELRAYVVMLAERADRLRQVDAREDNMLKICGDGRKAALELGLVGIATTRPGKVDAVIANVARLYHQSRELVLPGDVPGGPRGGFQIVFCDLGTPGPAGGSAVYGKIRDGLDAAGMPVGQVRFIHDANTDLRKAPLFADCRAGKVAVLLGSTDKLGVGTNIQTRCIALHHVDAPWRPADVEQREGRALRPGNRNSSVEIFRYVSEKSFDSFMWQTLERKARFIGQVLGGRTTGRDVDDIGDATLSYAEIKALATGNPLLLELAEANADVTRLRQLATGHTRAVRRLTESVTNWRQQISGRTRLAATCEQIAGTAGGHAAQGWSDHRCNPIPGADVPGYLAKLAAQAIGSNCYGTAIWRGVRVSFSAQRSWRQVVLVATISTGLSDLPVEFNPAWTEKGQQWRIEKELTDRIDGAAAQAERLRREIGDLEQRVADAVRRIAEPFPRAAELEAARSRRDDIERQIRDAATTPDDNTETRNSKMLGEPDDDLAAVTFHDDLGLTGLDSEQAITFFAPEELTRAVAFEVAALAEADRTLASADAGENGVSAARSEYARTATAPATESPEQTVLVLEDLAEAPLLDTAAVADAAAWDKAPPQRSSVNLQARPRLHDGGQEPLFALPDRAPDGAIPRFVTRQRSRRRPAQLAARDRSAQPTLFDLPEFQTPASHRKAARPGQNHTPRK